MKNHKLELGHSWIEEMSWGEIKYTVTRITEKCVFCSCTRNGIFDHAETRFKKDYFLTNN